MAASMNKLVSAVIGITVTVIVIATVLAPQVAQYTASGQALADYAGLLGAVIVLSIVGALMLAVSLITSGKN